MLIPFAVLAVLAAPDGVARFDPLTITAATVNGHRYAIYGAVESTFALTFTQPRESDERIRLAVAGTYTDQHNNVDGCTVIDGTPHNASACKPWRGVLQSTEHGLGLTVITEGGPPANSVMFRIPYLRTVMIGAVQAHVLVERHAAQSFAPQPRFQRRAFALIVRNSHRTLAIVESTEQMDLTTFANDLAALNAAEAANLDMGTLGLGWVRDPVTNAVRRIGTLDGKRVGQSNWIVLRAP